MTPSEDQPETQPGTSRAPSPLWPGTTETHRPGGNRGAARRADLRFRLLRALETRPDLGQRGRAEAIGISLGAANALLNAQIAAGLVNIADAATDPARFRIGYVLTEDGRAEMRRLRAPYLARRRAERTVLDAEIAALEAEVGVP